MIKKMEIYTTSLIEKESKFEFNRIKKFLEKFCPVYVVDKKDKKMCAKVIPDCITSFKNLNIKERINFMNGFMHWNSLDNKTLKDCVKEVELYKRGTHFSFPERKNVLVVPLYDFTENMVRILPDAQKYKFFHLLQVNESFVKYALPKWVSKEKNINVQRGNANELVNLLGEDIPMIEEEEEGGGGRVS